MAIYAIGDVQGCYDELQALLDKIAFDPAHDYLWFTGDLVNRGPKSLQVLRFVKGLGTRAVTVLGNHDLHLLSVAVGCSQLRADDTLEDIFHAPDRDELLTWLRHRPLLYRDEDTGYTLIHAGLPPQWTVSQAQIHAREVEETLRGAQYRDFFFHMYGNLPDHWGEALTKWDQLRFIVNCFTRLRYLTPAGKLCLNAKGPIGSQPSGCLPWFELENRQSRVDKILFGHWSTLGYCARDNIVALDSGCLWGGALSAVSLDDVGSPIHVKCRGAMRPHQYK
jgi:bis(5'-nucleosyl)-tetraphosphatase (symmetrical)